MLWRGFKVEVFTGIGFTLLAIWAMRRFMPVSYTHLDVYKRQGMCHGAFVRADHVRARGKRGTDV